MEQDPSQQRNMLREPCPWRIWSDCGGAFAMGTVGGSLFHGFKGFRNSPPGFGERMYASSVAIRRKAPVLGGSFAVWGLLFSSFDCSLGYIRGQEDAYNAVASGFLTGAALSIRGGWKAAGRAGLMGGFILAIIEGVQFQLMQMGQPPPPAPSSAPEPPNPMSAPSSSPDSSSSSSSSFSSGRDADMPEDEPFE